MFVWLTIRSFSSRLLLVVLATLLPLWILVFYTNYENHRQVREFAEQDASWMTSLAADEFEQRIQ